MKRKSYLFTSARLGFRNWLPEDAEALTSINSDPEVMEFFPALQDATQTLAFIGRMQKQFAEKGFCYFAVDTLENGEFIGFIGLSEQTFEAEFTPCIDIGWRLKKSSWNKGYATEGARRCLQYAFRDLKLEKVYAIAPKANIRSCHIMQKIGMQKAGEFIHPKLTDNKKLRECVLYEIQSR